VILFLSATPESMAWKESVLGSAVKSSLQTRGSLIVAIGGGWSILAHLCFVLAPTPLDWLTMFTLIMFAASFIAVGRRGLLQ
jgi:hypothetical protein